jgi:Ca-activated chloride channel homolog
MQLKSTILTFLFLIYGSLLHSKTNPNNIQTANEHIEFIDRVTTKLINTQSCLLLLYSRLEGARKQQRYSYIGQGYICANFISEKYFNNLLIKTKKLNTKYAMSLNTHAQKLYDISLIINNLSRGLEVYVRLGDYKKDQAKKADEIFNKLVVEFDNFINQKNTYYQYIKEIAEPFETGGATKKYQAYLSMREFVNEEEQLILKLKTNFCSKTFTAGLPTELILNQVKESDGRISSLKKEYGNLTSSFVNIAEKQIQKTKRNAIDDFSIYARKSDGYTNSFINNYRIYLNYYLIKDFNQFVKSSGLHLLQYPRIITALKLDCTKKTFSQNMVKYEAGEIPKIITNKQSTKISKETANTLNNYIEFINTELHYNWDFASKLFHLNKSANRQLEKNAEKLYLSFMYYDKYALPTAAYEKTLNDSKYINSNYAKALNALLKELMGIITEKYHLVLVLDDYIKNKKFSDDRFEKLYKYLERFEYLIKMFDERKEQLYLTIRQIAESYQPAISSPWNTGANAMLKQADASLLTLNTVKAELRNNTIQKVQANKVTEISRDLLIKEYDNLKGLKKIGRNNGNCPYTPYEDIAKTASYFAEKVEKFPSTDYIKRVGWYKYYRDFVYQYNEMVKDCNKFARLAAGGYDTFKSHKQAPLYLLQNVRQLVPFKLTLPQKKEVTEKIEPSKDTTSISMEGFAANNLILLLDVSGSMKAEDKLPLLRNSFLEILPYLRNEDEISIIVFSGKGKVLLNAVSCSKKEKITDVLEGLESKGQTDFSKGLKLAYKTAEKNFNQNANNRIIVATDGAFLVNDELYKLSEDKSDKKIFLSVFSFGNKDKEIRSLSKLANKGKGNYEYIEISNATKQLLKELQALRLK